MATRQPSKAAKTRAANAKKKAAKQQLRAIVLFTAGLFLLLIAVIEGSGGWKFTHDVLLGIFSISAYFVGPLCIMVAVLISLGREDMPATHRAWQAGVLVLLISAAAQIFSQGQPIGNILQIVQALYTQGQDLQGGGVLSLLLGIPLLMLLDSTGAAIVVSLLLFLFIMIISGATIAGLVRRAVYPVKRIGEAYAVREPSPPKTTTTISTPKQEKTPAKSRFDIDIPLDAPGEEVKTVGENSTDRDQLLKSAKELENPTQNSDIVAEEQTVTPVTNEIDELVSKAVSGEATIAPVFPSPTNPADGGGSGTKFDFTPTGDTLQKGDGGVFVVPPIDHALPNAAQAEELIVSPVTPAQPKPTPTPTVTTATTETTPAVMLEHLAPKYTYPPINLLEEGASSAGGDMTDELRRNAERLVDTLKSFGVQTRVVDISRGPAVTRYELQPSAGVKISRITNLADDIALNLAAAGVRIEAPIPGKAAVGIEVPNKSISAVTIREVIDSAPFSKADSKVSVALGKDITGNLAVADLSKMPHLLIAGSTGSGKSVCINSFIISLLYKADPDEVKIMMIDPKVVELGSYNGIPHLLVPVVTDPRKAAGALCWAVGEMMKRYKLFSERGVRDITGYNRMAQKEQDMQALPQIVIIIDELADLMMVCPNDVEDYICRLAQMARAAGMHLVIATQRPSVDVITGIIKANIPSRVAFAVSSQVDSRTILDGSGAEKLLGRGDMLYYPVGSAKPTRVQGCFVTDKEVERVVAFIKEGEKNEYDAGIMEEIEKGAAATGGKKGAGASTGGGDSDEDETVIQAAIEAVVEAGQASTSYLQRKLKLGYARAARVVDELESRGIVGPFEGSKPRTVLISKERWYEMKLNSEE